MAVSATRFALYIVGVLLIVAALWMFLMQTGLNQWIPGTLIAAGVLLIIGLAVMSFAQESPEVRPPSEHHHDDTGGDVTVVKH